MRLSSPKRSFISIKEKYHRKDTDSATPLCAKQKALEISRKSNSQDNKDTLEHVPFSWLFFFFFHPTKHNMNKLC